MYQVPPDIDPDSDFTTIPRAEKLIPLCVDGMERLKSYSILAFGLYQKSFLIDSELRAGEGRVWNQASMSSPLLVQSSE